MTSTKRKFRFLVVLYIQTAIWSSSTCKPVKTVQQSPWDDWFFTPPTFRPPYFWTVEPTSDYSYKSSGTDGTLLLIIFVPTFILCLLIWICQYLIGKLKEDSRESFTTLHLPPSRTIHNPQNRTGPSQRVSFSPVFETGASGQQTRTTPGVPSTHNAERPSTSNVGDKPPGYFDVVREDLITADKKFPVVSPKLHETPPPKYEDGSLPRF